jgi:hypothetical protein
MNGSELYECMKGVRYFWRSAQDVPTMKGSDNRAIKQKKVLNLILHLLALEIAS